MKRFLLFLLCVPLLSVAFIASAVAGTGAMVMLAPDAVAGITGEPVDDPGWLPPFPDEASGVIQFTDADFDQLVPTVPDEGWGGFCQINGHCFVLADAPGSIQLGSLSPPPANALAPSNIGFWPLVGSSLAPS